MPTVSVRYIEHDVDAAIRFYCGHLGFDEVMHPAPSFAMLAKGDLRLVLSAPGGGPGGGQAMPDGSLPEPGGWNRFSVEVDDIDAAAQALSQAGVTFRNDVVTGVGGRQVLIDDPSGNPVELFQPTRSEARLDEDSRTASAAGPQTGAMELRRIGWVESVLADPSAAPRQGDGAPDAWLAFTPDVAEAMRDLAVDQELLLITWLHQADRDVRSTYPGADPSGPVTGVFSLRSPARPNPLGLHRVRVLEINGTRVHVDRLEAVDGTPIVDVKPVIDDRER